MPVRNTALPTLRTFVGNASVPNDKPTCHNIKSTPRRSKSCPSQGATTTLRQAGNTPRTACCRFSLSRHTLPSAKIQGIPRIHNASSRVVIVESTHVLDFRSFFTSSDHRIYRYCRILGASCVVAFTQQPLF